MQVYEAANILIEKIKRDYPEDISVVVVMGSHIYQATHKKSDLDLYFVPKTDRGYELGQVFIMQDIGFDFWPISWDRMERIAHHDERISSIISEGQVIYAGSDEDLYRFNQLREKTLDYTYPEYQKQVMNKFDSVYQAYVNLLNQKTKEKTRIQMVKVLYILTETLALLNKQAIKRGRSYLKDEILSMKLIPTHFSVDYDRLFMEDDPKIIQETLLRMIHEIKALVYPKQALKSLSQEGEGFYEEIINFYNKIEHAYETHDPVLALFAAAEINLELHEILGDTELDIDALPKMLENYHPKHLDTLYQLSLKHKEMLKHMLNSHGVNIKEFDDMDDLKKHYHL